MSKEIQVICELKERKIDEQARTVIAGVLESDSLSTNNRFYPHEVVTAAAKTLAGKRSLIGHETDDVRDVVAKITEAGMVGRVLQAKFKFGTDAVSETVFSKVKEGLVDSVSIRATGETKRVKMGEDFVDMVEKLDIYSVDWVVEGGVEAAKVVKVFEQSPSYEKAPQEKETTMSEKTPEQLKQELKEKDELIKKQAEENRVANEKAEKAQLDAHISEKLFTIRDEESRKDIKDGFHGKTVAEFDAYFASQVKLLERLSKKAGAKEQVIIKANETAPEAKEHKTLEEVMESSDVSAQDKVGVLHELMGGRKK